MRRKRTTEPVFLPNDKPQKSDDTLDRWQYKIFKIVLFIIGLYFMWQFLNAHVPVGKAVSKLFGG
jgi:hypothetical protein